MRRITLRAMVALTLFVGTVCVTACSSIKTKIYDSDNVTSEDRQVKRLRGVPITIDVPTHIRIAVDETQYILATPILAQAKDKDGKEITVTESTKFSASKLMPFSRTMRYDIVTKKELFTVDFKRPFVGKNDLKLTFDGTASGGQYFKSIAQDIDDQSITEVANLVDKVSAVIPSLIKAKATSDTVADAATARLKAKGYVVATGTVAVEYFDIHQPHVEAAIQAFLEKHVNCCSEQCAAPGPVIAVPTNPVILQSGTSPLLPQRR